MPSLPFHRLRPALLLLAAAGALAAARPAAAFEWQSATPESQGLSTARLDAFRDEQAAHHTSALLIVRNDRIVYEWYAPGTTAQTRLGTASMAKALVVGMTAGLELDDGLIGLDDRAAYYVPQWRDDPQKSQITLSELGDHTSGLDDAEIMQHPGDARAPENYLPHDKLPGWQGEFWARKPRDPFTLARDVVPLIFAPGTAYSYSNPGIAMLGYAETAALREGGAPQGDIRSYLRARLMGPIGVADRDWSVGYGQTYPVDGLPLVAGWGGGAYTARAYARIGRLMLREGDWDGRRILSRAAVRTITRHPAGAPGRVAIGWWTNYGQAMPEVPEDAYYAAGAGDRRLVVIPSLNAIVVRNGENLTTSGSYNQADHTLFFVPMMQALTGAGPSPATP